MVPFSIIKAQLGGPLPVIRNSSALSNNLRLALRIESGEVVGRVKDVSVVGTVCQDLYRIEALSLESEGVYGGIRLPDVLLKALEA